MAIKIKDKNGNVIQVAGVGKPGTPGQNGTSAYQAAVAGGYTGTEADFNERMAKGVFVGTGTALATGWTGQQNTVAITGLPASVTGIVGVSGSAGDDAWQAAVAAVLRPVSQAAGSVTIKALGTPPDVDIPISVYYWPDTGSPVLLSMFPGTGEQIPLDAPTGFTGTAGNAQVTLTWTDPKDKYATPEGETTEEGDQLVSEWAYTRIIRKTGSAPTGPNDGVLVVESSVRDQYSTTGYVDDDLTNGTTYYYGAYAYNKDGVASEGAMVSVEVGAYYPVLEDNTWAQISAASEAGVGSSLWAIGDTHSLTINGQVGTQTFNNYATFIFIIGFDHNAAVEGAGITFQGFKDSSGRDICLVGPNYGKSATGENDFCMDTTSATAGGWASSDMRAYTLGSDNAASPRANTLIAALPADLRAVLKPMTIWTNNTGNGVNTASATTDYLPLMAEFEVFGAINAAASAESQHQQQYAYYSSGNSKVKYRHDSPGTAAMWFERSPYGGSGVQWCLVRSNGTSGMETVPPSGQSLGVAPILRI